MEPESPQHSASNAVDRLGTIASSACAAHCAMCALLPSAMAALGLGALLGHSAEWGFTLVAVLFAGLAITLAWRKHGSKKVALVFGAGITGLMLARLLEEAGVHIAGTVIGVLAGGCLVIGHISNIRLSRRARLERA